MSMSDNQRHPGSYVVLDTEPDVQCLVCTRFFTLGAEVTDSFEALAICSECKMTVLGDDNRDYASSTYRERRRRRPRSRATRHEPTEDTFSQQFSQLLNLARQGHEADTDSPIVTRQQASYSSTPNRSQRSHASDDESDGLSYVDSVLGEIESIISFGDYDGESDASLDLHIRMGREVIIQHDSESYMNTDTDIDPMNAGMGHWDSDDQEDDALQSEESDFDEPLETMQHHQQWHAIAQNGLSDQESEGVVLISAGTQGVNITNLRADTDGPEIRSPFIGNPGDYVDARQFEILLGQFAEDDNIRTGAPPAATSFVENIPSVVISTSHDPTGGVICPVCKDHMPINTTAKQLPCKHIYHSSCILPWLSSRNTCPVCRYELPTDDPEYERSKQATSNERGIHGMAHAHPHETIEEISGEPEIEGTYHSHGPTVEETTVSEHIVHPARPPNEARGHHRWLFIAAAPIVSIVSIALVLCFTNPSSNVRRQLNRRSHGTTTGHVGARRSWWSMF